MTETLQLTIWGREFTLPIEYDCYKDEKISKRQKSAVRRFAKHTDWVASSKGIVEEFCKERVFEDDENLKKDNIFSYIKPDYLYIKRDDENPKVAIMCKYRYEPEHGLAVIFSWDGKITVGIQDIIL